jgi:putative membrane protein
MAMSMMVFAFLALSIAGSTRAVLAETPLEQALALPSVDRAFVAQTEHSGEMEIELGKVALVNSRDDRVKRFAQRLMDDRAKLDDVLARAAKDQRVSVVPELKPYQRVTIDWIAQLKGEAFDREYLQLAVMDEQSMRDEFEVEAQSGQVPALKGIAEAALPTLEHDLKVGDRARAELSSPAGS